MFNVHGVLLSSVFKAVVSFFFVFFSVSQAGSFLIRESDSTPGDYVLYLFTGSNIQRFKIHRKNANRFEVGGRPYERSV